MEYHESWSQNRLAHPGAGDDTADYCDVWNLNHGICNYVKEGYFYYPTEWHGKAYCRVEAAGDDKARERAEEKERLRVPSAS